MKLKNKSSILACSISILATYFISNLALSAEIPQESYQKSYAVAKKICTKQKIIPFTKVNEPQATKEEEKEKGKEAFTKDKINMYVEGGIGYHFAATDILINKTPTPPNIGIIHIQNETAPFTIGAEIGYILNDTISIGAAIDYHKMELTQDDPNVTYEKDNFAHINMLRGLVKLNIDYIIQRKTGIYASLGLGLVQLNSNNSIIDREVNVSTLIEVGFIFKTNKQLYWRLGYRFNTFGKIDFNTDGNYKTDDGNKNIIGHDVRLSVGYKF